MLISYSIRVRGDEGCERRGVEGENDRALTWWSLAYCRRRLMSEPLPKALCRLAWKASVG